MTRYRVKAEHPGRPGQPLRITNKAGALIAVSGETVDHLPAEYVASMRAQGWLEPVLDPVAPASSTDVAMDLGDRVDVDPEEGT